MGTVGIDKAGQSIGRCIMEQIRYPEEIKMDHIEAMYRKEVAKKNTSRRWNGQAFILHIGAHGMCYKMSQADIDNGTWGPSFTLIKYLTHRAGISRRGYAAYWSWIDYVRSL
jgi:hypothetical protein